MPDLPSDIYDDDDPLYQPVDYASFEPQYGDGEDNESFLDPGLYPDDADGYAEERPRRRSRRPLDDDAFGEVGGRRRSRRADDDLDEVEVLQPSRRKPRRVPKEERYDDPRPRRRQQRRESHDYDSYDEITMAPVDRYEDRVRSAYQAPARNDRSRPARPVIRPRRQDDVIGEPRMRMEAASADIVTNIQPTTSSGVARQRVRRTRRNPAWEWRPIVLPQPRQMLVQAWPSLVMAISVLGTLMALRFIPGGLPVWASLILLPSVLLLFRADDARHPMWKRSALVNLVVVGAFFPLMIVRQSFLRIPFVEFGNGTLVMPILSTLLVVAAMAVIALGSAYLSQEDPEYAGMLFLPAALLVPFFAGATEITSLGTALGIVGVIYVACALLTVVASMLPAAFPTLVAPIALAMEFFVLPLSESAPIFPVGAGMSAKLLFFIVLTMGVGLTLAVPMLAVWVRQVRRIVWDAHLPSASVSVAA